MNIEDFLNYVVDRQGSDLHLSSGMPPICRIDGDLHYIEKQNALENSKLLAMLKTVIPPKLFTLLLDNNEIDFSYNLPNVARCRVNAFQQLNGVSAVFRIIPLVIPTLESLGMPPIVSYWANGLWENHNFGRHVKSN